MCDLKGILQNQLGKPSVRGKRGRGLSSRWAIVITLVAMTATASTAKADHGEREPVNSFRALETGVGSERSLIDERQAIQSIDIPFLQDEGDWEHPGHGISMRSLGEPKSGTTWTERIITELALELCGSLTNTWCKMGRLEIIPNDPDPSYRWETIDANSGELFLHFDGKRKHLIPGLEVEECNPRGNPHYNTWGERFPCKERISNATRENLLQCLPDTSNSCVQRMPSRDPAVRRTTIVFRDAREIVISEHRMRVEVYHMEGTGPLVPFIHKRFETIVAWQFVRWMWHSTFYKDSSHIMFYEDLQASHEPLRYLAAFIGLESSDEQLRKVWMKHRNRSPHGGFETYDLPVETVNFMTTIMSRLLPEEILARYGLAQISH